MALGTAHSKQMAMAENQNGWVRVGRGSKGEVAWYLCIIVSPHRYAKHKMRPTAIDVAWSVCLSVCWTHQELC